VGSTWVGSGRLELSPTVISLIVVIVGTLCLSLTFEGKARGLPQEWCPGKEFQPF